MANPITFAEFRLSVASDLMDGLELTATSDGSTTQFIDNLTLVDGPDQFRSSFGVVISATNASNVGRVVRIDSSSPTSTSITFANALPAITKSGDVMHLFNLGGYGMRPQFYDLAIQEAIRAAYPDYVEEIVLTGASAFDADSPTIPIVAPMTAVYAVEIEEEADAWRTIPKARQAGTWGEGWTLSRPTSELRIDGEWRQIADGMTYRVRGYQRADLPSAAGDPITIDLMWLTYEVKARLSARRRTDRQLQNWGVEWGRQAENARMRIQTPREADTEWL